MRGHREMHSAQESSFHPLYVFLACSVVLLSTHPSLQSPLKSLGVPSFAIAVVMALPLVVVLAKIRSVDRRLITVLLSFAVYITWMLSRGLFSPSMGSSDYFASVRSLLILMPLSLFCAVVAAGNHHAAARVILSFGVVAIVHFVGIFVAGDPFSNAPGFRALSGDQDSQNYQATSYYFGFAGLYFLVLGLRGSGTWSLLSLAGGCATIVLMALVGARSSIVALALAVFFILLKGGGAFFLYAIARVLILIAALTAALRISGLIDFSMLEDQFVIIDRFVSLVQDDDSSGREWLFKSAIAMWLDSACNLLIGAGLATFPLFIGMAGEDGWYPHNFILESLAEGGLAAGLALFLAGRSLVVQLIRTDARLAKPAITYLGALAVYSVAAFQFMGGIQTLWIPTFFVAVYVFSSCKIEI